MTKSGFNKFMTGAFLVILNVALGNTLVAAILCFFWAFIIWIDSRLDYQLEYEKAKLKEAVEISDRIKALSFVAEAANKGIKEPYNIIKLAKEHNLKPEVITYIEDMLQDLNTKD